jgi:sterol desaturase/sphingolipid hydroxylase (fatty acid hydroxylase superfamily)
MHHRYVHYNYGLYFNFWDRVMGTNHPRYEQEYDRVCAKPSGETPREPAPGFAAEGGLHPL